MQSIFTACLMLFVSLISFAGTAVAAGAVSPDDGTLLDLAKPILDAVMKGQWAFAAAAALVLCVAAAKRYAGKKFPFLHTDMGGVTLTLLGSFGGAMVTALAAGSAPTWALAFMAMKVAAGAAGGYAMLKKTLVPALALLRPKMPTMLRPVVDLILWVFAKPSATETAETAGDAAVHEHPAGGIEGILGEADDLR